VGLNVSVPRSPPDKGVHGAMSELPPIVTKAYDFTQWLLPRVQDFPRSS
jgi:hypothetical protein